MSMFVSSVKYGQVTSFGQGSGKKFEMGGEENFHIYKTFGNLFVSLTRYYLKSSGVYED